MAPRKSRPVDEKTGLPATKLSMLVNLMVAGEWDKALALANSFPQLGDHDVAIRRGHEAVIRADFQRQLGKDPVKLRDEGIRALVERYAEPLKAAGGPKYPPSWYRASREPAAFEIKKLKASGDECRGRWEVFTPGGWQFDGGEHSRIVYSRADAEREAQRDNIFRCPDDCDCGWLEGRIEKERMP